MAKEAFILFIPYIINTKTKKIKEKKSYITLKYKIKNNTKDIKLFGKKFVENNKGFCRLKINEKEIELCEFYELEKRENVNVKV